MLVSMLRIISSFLNYIITIAMSSTDTTSGTVEKKENKYITSGHELLTKYKQLFDDDVTVRMFPYIISYSAIEKGKTINTKYEDNRKSSEAELEVFTSLKKMLKKLKYNGSIMIHSFSYELDMLKELEINDADQILKKGDKIEHDLLIMIPKNVFIVVEVKNSENASSSASKQLKTAERFIKSVCLKYKVEQPIVLKVKAFPLVNMPHTESTSEHDYLILCKNVIENESKFSTWWDEYMSKQFMSTDSTESFQRVQEVCVGIWASKNDGKLNLSDLVNTIDKRLREANLCQGKKNEVMTKTIASLNGAKGGIPIPENVIPSNVKKLISRNRSNPIKYLTDEQVKVLSDDQYKHCIIRGPGGSGKTVAMLINVVRLYYKEKSEGILIVAHDERCARGLQRALKSYKVEVKISTINRTNKQETIENSVTNNSQTHNNLPHITSTTYVTITYVKGSANVVKNLDAVIQKGKYRNVFIDDFQCKEFRAVHFETLSKDKDLSKDLEYFWILGDEVQDPLATKSSSSREWTMAQQKIADCKKKGFQEKTLSKVVRSTKEIAEAALKVREKIHDIDKKDVRSRFEIPGCQPFHLIHGPKPHLLFLSTQQDPNTSLDSDVGYIDDFKGRYDGVRCGILTNKDIALLELKDKDNGRMYPEYGVDGSDYFFPESAIAQEFTAVLGLITPKKNSDGQIKLERMFKEMYIMLSRARVIAELIVYDCYDNQGNICFDIEPLENLFEIKYK